MISMFAKVKNFGSLWSPLDRIHFCKHNFHFYESWRRLIWLFALLILPYEIYVSKMDSSQYWSWKKWIPFCHFEILTVRPKISILFLFSWWATSNKIMCDFLQRIMTTLHAIAHMVHSTVHSHHHCSFLKPTISNNQVPQSALKSFILMEYHGFTCLKSTSGLNGLLCSTVRVIEGNLRM